MSKSKKKHLKEALEHIKKVLSCLEKHSDQNKEHPKRMGVVKKLADVGVKIKRNKTK